MVNVGLVLMLSFGTFGAAVSVMLIPIVMRRRVRLWQSVTLYVLGVLACAVCAGACIDAVAPVFTHSVAEQQTCMLVAIGNAMGAAIGLAGGRIRYLQVKNAPLD